MIAASQNRSHSARVEKTLIIDGTQFEIAQATPTHLYLRMPGEIRTGTDELPISIDGSVTRQTVQLLNNSQLSSPVVPFHRVG
jgi:hypothetical protein